MWKGNVGGVKHPNPPLSTPLHKTCKEYWKCLSKFDLPWESERASKTCQSVASLELSDVRQISTPWWRVLIAPVIRHSWSIKVFNRFHLRREIWSFATNIVTDRFHLRAYICIFSSILITYGCYVCSGVRGGGRIPN